MTIGQFKPLDLTGAHVPPVVRLPEADQTPLQDIADQEAETAFIAVQPAPVASWPTGPWHGTLTSAEMQAAARGPSRSVVKPVTRNISEVDVTQDRRLILLAKRYEGRASTEETARFHILTERLRKLSPRVSEADFETLDEALDALEASSERLERLKVRIQQR